MICYESEMEAQRAMTEIDRYKGWRAEKYITNKVTRTGNQFKERTTARKKKRPTNQEKKKMKEHAMPVVQRTQNKRL